MPTTRGKIAEALLRSVVARLMMMLHGVLCVLKTNPFEKHRLHWIFIVPLALLPVEGVVTWKFLKGKEWKWICPCVLLYLIGVIPPVWLAETDLVIMFEQANSTVSVISEDTAYSLGHGKKNITAHFEKSLLGFDTGLSFQDETRILMEEMMLLVLIIGRWILPRQQITKEQKSALLIGYIGMSADILELYEYFKDDRLKTNMYIVTLLLVAWSSAMCQFIFVFTARRVVHCETSLGSLVFNTDMWAIVCNLLLQDAPFLLIRFYLLVQYKIVSETSIFFLVKNSLLTFLILHRIHSLVADWRSERRNALTRSQSQRGRNGSGGGDDDGNGGDVEAARSLREKEATAADAEAAMEAEAAVETEAEAETATEAEAEIATEAEVEAKTMA